MYGYICPECGAHLDPGELCDCIFNHEERNRENRERIMKIEELLEQEDGGQLRLVV